MKKYTRWLSVLLIMTLLATVLPVMAETDSVDLRMNAGTPEDFDAPGPAVMMSGPTAYVDNAEDFIAAIEADASANIVITGSFSLGGYNSHTYFSGILDGQGNTITVNATVADNGACGLFAGIYGGAVYNLNVAGTVSVSTTSAYMKVGLLCGALDAGGTISNCNVSGTVNVSQGGTSAQVFAGGLAGLGTEGGIDNCTSSVNITVTTSNNVIVGGLLGMLNSGTIRKCAYDGSIRVEQAGNNSSAELKASGTTYPGGNFCYRCDADGDIQVITTNGSGYASGLCRTEHGTNNATVSASTQSGSAYATGCSEGYDVDNTGVVTASVTSGGLANACGLNSVHYGENSGSITATAENGNAYACGAQGALGHVTNTAQVRATTQSGDASAVGVNGVGSGSNGAFECENNGNVYTSSDHGRSVAIGMSDCVKSKNLGAVTSTGKNGDVVAQGTVNVSYGQNRGSVTVSYNGETAVGATSGQGLNSCYATDNYGTVTVSVSGTRTGATATGISGGGNCRNYAKISATNSTGPAVARGVMGSNSENHAEVFAHSTYDKTGEAANATAYGVGSGSNSMNSGAIKAISATGGAHAYGHHGVSSCSSTGAVTAEAPYFVVHEGEDFTEGWVGTATAENSTSVSATSASFTISASGGARRNMYYFIARSSCSDHAGMSRQFVSFPAGTTDLDSCYVPCGHAYSTGEGGYVTPETPAAPDEPDDPEDEDYDVTLSTKIKNVAFYDFTYAFGSLRCGPADQGNDFGDPFILNISVWSRNSESRSFKVKLPEGFSFKPWEIEQETTVDFILSAGNTSQKPLTVYPVYMPAYTSSVTFEVYKTGDGAQTRLGHVKRAVVYGPDNGVGLMKVRPTKGVNGSDDAINVTGQEFGLDFSSSSFVDMNGSYDAMLAKLGCVLTQSIYGTTSGNESVYIIESLNNLGFSKGEWYKPGNESKEIAAYVAQKKIAKDGKVRNLLMVVLRGTYRMDWIGNLLAYELGGGEGHMNFHYAAEKIRTFINGYVRDNMTAEDVARTNAYICGHSRAAAVADLLCYWAECNGWRSSFCDKLTSYTFAAPSSLNHMPPASGTVHNIMYYSDIVPYVPFEMYKYGKTYVLGSLFDAPSAVKQKWNQYVRNSSYPYPTPRNGLLISLIILGGLSIETEHFTKDVYNDLPPISKAVCNAFLMWKDRRLETIGTKFAKGELVFYLTQYVIAQVGGRIIASLNETTGAVAEAHGAENYLSWMMTVGVGGGFKSYEEVQEEWLTGDVLGEYWDELLLPGLEKLGQKIADGVNATKNWLVEKAEYMLDNAMARLDQAEQAVDTAWFLVETAGEEAAMAAYKAAVAAKRKVEEEVDLARHAIQTALDMQRQFEQSVLRNISPVMFIGAEENSPGHTIISVSCPVNVQLNEVSGENALSFASHALVSESGFDYGESVEDTDFIVLTENEASRLKITGTDTGSMNVAVMNFDRQGSLRAYYGYLGVPVEAGEEFTLDMTDGNAGGGRALISSTGISFPSVGADSLELLSVTSSTDLAQVGEEVTFTVNTIGGKGALTYACDLYRDGERIEQMETSEAELTLTFDEPGEYALEVCITDTTGTQAGPMRSAAVTVYEGTADSRWAYVDGLQDSVVAADGIWIGNIYGVNYDGAWLDSWQDYDVSVLVNREGASVEVGRVDGWTDGINFFLHGVEDTNDLLVTVTVHKTGDTDGNYDDLRYTHKVRTLAGDDVTPPVMATVDERPLVIHVGEVHVIDKPGFVDEEAANAWWVGCEFDNWSYCLLNDNGDGTCTLQGTMKGEAVLGFYPGSYSFHAPVQRSRRVIVLDANESLVDGAAASMALKADTRFGQTRTVTWRASGVDGGSAVSYRFDLYMNGKLSKAGVWQNSPECSYALTGVGLYEVRLTLRDENGNERTCDAMESAKALVEPANALWLPADLIDIGPEAFMGTAAVEYRLSDYVMRVGERAFAGSSKLRIVCIPARRTIIASNAFYGDNNVVIVCPLDSDAQRFAQANNMLYMLTE